jgi:choline-glycine betaine transporter
MCANFLGGCWNLLQVAVKVLDGHAVVRRDEATGFCLEALLSESLRHPNVVRTLAWAVVVGEVCPVHLLPIQQALRLDRAECSAIAVACPMTCCLVCTGAWC